MNPSEALSAIAALRPVGGGKTRVCSPMEAVAERNTLITHIFEIVDTALASPVPDAVPDIADGNRPLPCDRDTLGRLVREAWVRWAETQPSPKPSWLLPFDDLSEEDKEADRQIGEAVARWTLIHDAARASRAADIASPAGVDEKALVWSKTEGLAWIAPAFAGEYLVAERVDGLGWNCISPEHESVALAVSLAVAKAAAEADFKSRSSPSPAPGEAGEMLQRMEAALKELAKAARIFDDCTGIELVQKASQEIERMREGLRDLTGSVDAYNWADDDHTVYMSVGRLRRARELAGKEG